MNWRDRIANAVLGGKVGGPTERGIQFYHSSPHDFDRFDLSRIGTGEGAQVYGHGIYGAENPQVSGRGGEYWNTFVDRFPKEEALAARYLEETGFDRGKAAALARHELDTMSVLALQNRGLQAAQLLEGNKPILGPRTYEVRYNVDPNALLDWDKPIKAQPSSTALAEIGKPYGLDFERWGMNDRPGQDFYRGLVRHGKFFAEAPDPKAWASQVLNEGGVPGIRYLDAGSRGMNAEELQKAQQLADHWRATHAANPTEANATMLRGAESALADAQQRYPVTYNVVAFDPNRLDIMAKYGVVGGVPLGAIAAQDQYGQGAQQ